MSAIQLEVCIDNYASTANNRKDDCLLPSNEHTAYATQCMQRQGNMWTA